MQSGGVLGGPAETAKSKQKHPLASISLKIEGMLVKSCSLDGFWAARLKPRKVSKSTHWLQYRSNLRNAGKIMQSGGVLGGQDETAKSKQKYPLAAKSFKIEGMLVKSCSLEGFWAVRLKLRKVSKSTHRLQYRSKFEECW